MTLHRYGINMGILRKIRHNAGQMAIALSAVIYAYGDYDSVILYFPWHK